MKYISIITTCFLLMNVSNAQNTIGLDWVGFEEESDSTITRCGGGPKEDLILSITSSTNPINPDEGAPSHAPGGEPLGLLLPSYPTYSTLDQVWVQFEFSSPVNDLSLRVIDLDENVNTNGSHPNPEEYLSFFNEFPSSITAIDGHPVYFMDSSPEIITPDDNSTSNNNDTWGWLNWSGEITEVSFVYNRPGPQYGLIIDSLRFKCSSTSSIGCNNCNQEESVKIWPNPTYSSVQIQVSSPTTGKSRIRLIDTSGRIMREVNTFGQQSTLSVRELEAGIYFVEYTSLKQERVTGRKKLIIK